MKLLDYSIQISMLRNLLNKRLINESEYIKVNKKQTLKASLINENTIKASPKSLERHLREMKH
ncbi:SHOCT domain-containing protein [Paraclostridium bifermentans]|uniref:SHOCT domain-containing protein n=1 Tax=Paraclostridium bifermentans TaxID=1490 RepID=UPI0022E30EC2|nr:SHOCT domain-containing protein [Paraclostridium bifermentans]